MIGRRKLAPAPTVADLVDLLSDLGGSPGDIAHRLSALGVRGVPTDVNQCAIAVYLNAVVGADRHVHSLSVWNDRVRVTFGRILTQSCDVPLSSCLQEFIDRFDARSYPELVRSVDRNEHTAH
ncbi:MAG: hypothetical protein M0004_17305 [Actinomycetota bacterium]|nr:hypothetical protein [Actinomycetota bacterium]